MGFRADPDKILRLAIEVRYAGQRLHDGREEFDRPPLPPPSVFGNLSVSPRMAQQVDEDVRAGANAARALSAALTRTVDALHQTAFGYQELNRDTRGFFRKAADVVDPRDGH